LHGFTLGDAVHVARAWADGGDAAAAVTACMGGDLNLANGFTLADAVFVAHVWTGAERFPWDTS
jgi:hypothetical protein